MGNARFFSLIEYYVCCIHVHVHSDDLKFVDLEQNDQAVSSIYEHFDLGRESLLEIL